VYRNALGLLGDLTYQYDPAGNRVSVGGSFARTLLPSRVNSAAYDAANQQLTFGDKTMTFDANGNLTSDGTSTYAWNARNQLIGLDGGVTARFSYDGRGRRQRRTIGTSGTDFLYDGLTPVQEQDGSTILVTLLGGLGIDEVFSRTDSGGTRAFLTDGLGSTVALTDSAGTLQTDYTYEPFGRTAIGGTPNANPFQYTGRENDGTGLYYYRARYYSPTLQRFISEDPIEFYGGDVNLYTYVSNSPVDLADPTGEAINWPVSPHCRPSRRGSKSEDNSSADSSGSWVKELLRDIACDPTTGLPGPGMVKGPTSGMIKQFERQLARHGLKSLEKSLRSLERKLAEHTRDLAKYAEKGGHTSSVETEIRNFQAQIEAIKQVLSRWRGR
jgi:RHS repeat-associated protein